MKKLRIFSVIAVFSLLVCLCCTPVYATSTSDSDSAVSGSDVIAPAASLSDYELVKYKVPAHQLSFLVPDFETSFGAASNNLEIYAILSGYTLEEIINYSYDYYGSTLSYLYTGYSEDQSVSVNCVYFSDKYTQFIGNYDDLDEVDMQAIAATTSLLSNETVSSVVKIGGHTFLYEEYTDAATNTYSICVETIANGGKYQLFIDIIDATSSDKAIANKMIKSVRIGGLAPSNFGAANNGLVVALLVIVCILLALVLLLAFFVVRFSLYSKAAGGSFNIIGFSLPPMELVKAAFEADRDDDDDDDEHDDDDDDEDEEIDD